MTKEIPQVEATNTVEAIEPTSVEQLPSFLVQCLQLTNSSLNIIDPEALNIRCVHFLDGRVFFGVMLMETLDSFVFTCCVRFEWGEDGINDIRLRPFLGRPICRVFKSSIGSMSFELQKYVVFYYKYLRKFGVRDNPSYFTSTILDKLDVLIAEDENQNGGSVSSAQLEEVGKRGKDSFTPYQISERIH